MMVCVEGDPLNLDEKHQLFKCTAWTFGRVRQGLIHVRSVFNIDATFLTDKYKGKPLVVNEYDANNQLFPLPTNLLT
jgi:hypothetical protein